MPKAARAASTRKYPKAGSELAAAVDELGLLSTQLGMAKAVVRAYEAARARFVELACVKTAADEAKVAEGRDFIATAGERAIQKTIVDKEVVFKAMTRKLFVELSTFKMDDLKAHLTPTQMARAIKEERTGPRRVTVAAK